MIPHTTAAIWLAVALAIATGLVVISVLASAFPVHRILPQEMADVLRESL